MDKQHKDLILNMKHPKIAYLVGAISFLTAVAAIAYASGDENITTFTEQSQAYYQHKEDEAAFCSSCWFIGAGGALNQMKTENDTILVNNFATYAPLGNQNDLFTVNSPNTNASLFLYGGYTWAQKQTFLPEISLAMRYEYLSPTKISGSIDQYTLPGYYNYNYQMNASAHVFTLLSKVDLVTFGSFAPYVSVGVGIARDRLYNYQETDIPPANRDSAGFGDSSHMNFAFNLGAGLDYFINDNVSLALGYEHDDLGSLESNPAAAQYQGQRLSFGSLTANRILFNAFYKLQF